jgi:uncharacterized protein
MEYFFYCRDNPNTAALRDRLTEAHWSFMDHYAEAMIARGPTLTADGTLATGSMHIVDLPDAAAARVFAFEEPNYRAGVYAEVLVHRWRNELGHTMWEFEGDPAHNQRFLIIGHGKPDVSVDQDLPRLRQRFLEEHRSQLIACGPLLAEDGVTWLGSVILAELPDRAAADVFLAQDPYAQAELYKSVEIHRWQFGGRPAA